MCFLFGLYDRLLSHTINIPLYVFQMCMGKNVYEMMTSVGGKGTYTSVTMQATLNVVRKNKPLLAVKDRTTRHCEYETLVVLCNI